MGIGIFTTNDKHLFTHWSVVLMNPSHYSTELPLACSSMPDVLQTGSTVDLLVGFSQLELTAAGQFSGGPANGEG